MFTPLAGGDPCDGRDIGVGYSDLTSTTPVIVTDIRGDVLARTDIGPGVASGDGKACTFQFELDLEEESDGGDGFVAQLGRDGARGEATLTWDEFDVPFALFWQIGDSTFDAMGDEISRWSDTLNQCLEEGQLSIDECFDLAEQ